jgi:hypothetical protein
VTTVFGDIELGREFSDDDEVDDSAEQDGLATELPGSRTALESLQS